MEAGEGSGAVELPALELEPAAGMDFAHRFARLVAGRRDVPRFIDNTHCKNASDRCDELSWIVEDLWGVRSASVRFPHGGIVLIDKGQRDRYLPPLFGRPPPIRRYLESNDREPLSVAKVKALIHLRDGTPQPTRPPHLIE